MMLYRSLLFIATAMNDNEPKVGIKLLLISYYLPDSFESTHARISILVSFAVFIFE